MSCKNKNLVENYGDPHLHHGDSPIAVNEAAMHDCPGSCYFGDTWPAQEAIANSIESGRSLYADYGKGKDHCGCGSGHQFQKPGQPVAVTHNSDPNVRYQMPEDASANYEIGVGCSNLRCMCPNCHGDCKCPKFCPNVDQQLLKNKEVIEPFHGSLANMFKLQDQTTMYLLVGLILFLAWYFLTKRR